MTSPTINKVVTTITMGHYHQQSEGNIA